MHTPLRLCTHATPCEQVPGNLPTDWMLAMPTPTHNPNHNPKYIPNLNPNPPDIVVSAPMRTLLLCR